MPKTLKIVMQVVFVMIILLFLAAGGLYLYIDQALKPMAAREQAVTVMIPPGMRTMEIARLLQEKGLIRNHNVFQYYLLYTKQGSKFQAGKYLLTPGMSLDEIIAKLNEGDIVKEQTIRFTIPEGFTLQQIADKLSEEKIIDRQAFLDLTQHPQQFSQTRASEIPNDSKLQQPMEGYLFPETYEMKKGSTEHDIIERMLLELDKKLAVLPGDWPQQLTKHSIDFHQMMTIASLIEREVRVDDERALVAGVIYNRLAGDMPLQIDATVQYLMDEQKERLMESDLYKIDSPYNTYMYSGLPPGPIASPSLKSIQAALYPEASEYLFYVTKKDNTYRHLFAKTYDEHLKNIEASKLEAQQAGSQIGDNE